MKTILSVALGISLLCAQVALGDITFHNTGNCTVTFQYYFKVGYYGCNGWGGMTLQTSTYQREVQPYSTYVVPWWSELDQLACPGQDFGLRHAYDFVLLGVGNQSVNQHFDQASIDGGTITVDCAFNVTPDWPGADGPAAPPPCPEGMCCGTAGAGGAPPGDGGDGSPGDAAGPPGDGGVGAAGVGPAIGVGPGGFPGEGAGAPPPDDDDAGMPRWGVVEPMLNLWLTDTPLRYRPAQGPPIRLRLAYGQRERVIGYNPQLFGWGKNWNAAWLSYVTTKNNHTFKTVQLPGGGAVTFDQANATEAFGHLRFSGNTTTGYNLMFPDGSKFVYGLIVTNSAGVFQKAMLTERWNAASQKTRLDYASYDPSNPVIRLLYVVDGDGLTNTVSYVTANAYSTNLVSQVTDPFGRTATFAYDPQGRLTNITDVVSLASALVYDASGYVTDLITPYGTNRFQYTDSVGLNRPPYGRSVRMLEPDGSCQLYLYTNGAPGVASSYSSGAVPDTSPFSNNFENSALDQRNTFHWNRQQYSALSNTNLGSLSSTDFKIATMKHWLLADYLGGNSGVSYALSLERAPSPDGSTEGQKTWYDYFGKTNTQYRGTETLPLFVALVLPDGTTRFIRTIRNSLGAVTNSVDTYSAGASVALRTNIFDFAANEIDLLRVTNALGVRVVSNAFNAYHQVVTNFDALNQMTVFTYDASHRPLTISRPSGLVISNAFGADGFLSQRFEFGIATNNYTWANDLLQSRTDARGLTISNTWDALLRLRRVDFPDATFITNHYENLSLVRVNDRLGFTNSFGYDRLRRLIASTNANGVVARNGYCSCGSLAYVTNAWSTPVELITQNVFDYQGNQLYSINADQTVTNWFDALGRVICRGNERGYRWFYFNNQGLLTVVSNAYGPERIISYDKQDRPVYVTDANGVTVTNSYDDLNRLRSRGLPDGGVEYFGYSARGIIAYTNQLGLTNFFAYDEAGRKLFETNANWEVLRYTNSPAGDLLALVDGKGQVTKWDYDEYGHVTNKVDQAGTTILKYTYDANGRLTSRWSAAKGSTAYAHDPAGNLTSVNYPNSPDVSFAYDPMNRLTNMVDAVGTSAYTYTPAGRLQTEVTPFNTTVTNFYLNGLRTSLHTLAWTNAFFYDDAGRLTNVSSPAGSFSYAFAGPASRLTQKLSLPNGSYITNAYDNVARLRSTKLMTSGATVLDSAEYGYNPAHQRLTFTNAAGAFVTNRYDRIGQVHVADSSVDSEDRGYTYDTAWNLTYLTNEFYTVYFAVGSKNELTDSGRDGILDRAYTYDANGNLTVQDIQEDNFTATYSYDDENQLERWCYEETTGGGSSDDRQSVFVYDGLGRLRIRTEYAWDPEFEEWASLAEWHYVYDGMRVIQELWGYTPVCYTRGTDLSGTLEGAGGIGGLLARSDGYSVGNWTRHNFYHADGNGNITALETTNETLSASYRYDPFGNATVASGPLAVDNVYRFSSKEYHAGSGLYYFGLRWYAPGVQRWLNRDPIHESGGINMHGFVGNNPINQIDPYGLDYGNPVSGPSGPVGPSSPYGLGLPYYPSGFCYKPTPQKQLDKDCFKQCMQTWLGGNIWNYAMGMWTAGSVYAGGTAPIAVTIGELSGSIPAGTVGGAYAGTYLGVGPGVGATVVGGVVTTGGVLAAGGLGWGVGTLIQCTAHCYR